MAEVKEETTKALATSKTTASKLRIEEEPELIDLTQSPESIEQMLNEIERDHCDEQQQQRETSLREYEREYLCFEERINRVVLPERINRNQSSSDLKYERIKCLLKDWIFWTSNATTGNKQQEIDGDDLEIFKGYLLFTLVQIQNNELIGLVMRTFKRLAKFYGSFEWIKSYKEIEKAIKSEFYLLNGSIFII